MEEEEEGKMDERKRRERRRIVQEKESWGSGDIMLEKSTGLQNSHLRYTLLIIISPFRSIVSQQCF